MEFEIKKDFMIIVNKNPLIKFIKDDVREIYEAGNIITQKDGLKYQILENIYKGDLVPKVEYQIFTIAEISDMKIENKNVATNVEIKDIDTLIKNKFIYIK